MGLNQVMPDGRYMILHPTNIFGCVRSGIKEECSFGLKVAIMFKYILSSGAVHVDCKFISLLPKTNAGFLFIFRFSSCKPLQQH